MQRLPTTTTTDTGFELAKWLGGAAAGALLMYMLDPDRGSARRAQSAAAVRNAGTRTTETLGNVWHSASSRMSSAADEAIESVKSAVPDGGLGSTLSRMGRAAGEMLDDTVSKAKGAVGRASSAAGDIADEAISKAKTGMGGAEDSDRLSSARGAVSRAADTAADFYDDTRKTAGRLGKRLTQEVRGDSEGAWNPTMRNTALVGGGMLALMGLMRRSPMGTVLGLAGAALLARGAANQPLRTLVGRGTAGLGMAKGMSMDQAIDFEKTVHIDASPNEVYEQFANYENFPRFMSQVAEVRDLGRRRSHWCVKGPGGSRFEWTSVLTEQSRPNRLAWRSEPGAEIPNSGSIQFERHRGGTLVTVRMSYSPPAGALGHAFALLLGSDPKSKMDEDLARMKSFIEHGSMPRGAAQPGLLSRLLH
jgi:uncharacterized membrane protein